VAEKVGVCRLSFDSAVSCAPPDDPQQQRRAQLMLHNNEYSILILQPEAQNSTQMHSLL